LNVALVFIFSVERPVHVMPTPLEKPVSVWSPGSIGNVEFHSYLIFLKWLSSHFSASI
jgi:hypothetical protein